MTTPAPKLLSADELEVAVAICKSKTCEGYACCQWPANGGRIKCPVAGGGYDDAARAAIAALTPTATADVERLRGALEPFANEAALTRETMQDARLLRHTTLWQSKLTVGDLRRAATALAQAATEKEG